MSQSSSLDSDCPATGCPLPSKGVALPASTPSSSGCPVPHEKRGSYLSSLHSSSSSTSASISSSSPLATASRAQGCPVAHQRSGEPADDATPHLAYQHQQLPPPNAHGCAHTSSSSSAPLGLPLPTVSNDLTSDEDAHKLDPVYGELTPSGVIPAAGRGNSADGKYWENPSANALYRALKRKNKGIDAEHAMSVSAIHSAVTENSWNEIRRIESQVAPECKDLSLIRFAGMDGKYTIKARALRRLSGVLPFDRHDWYVSRCGKEVRYILDYYSMEDGDGNIEYTIDVRREPTLPGLWERAKYANHLRKNGEKWWL